VTPGLGVVAVNPALVRLAAAVVAVARALRIGQPS
jgi:hypothetical protein